MYDLVIIGAGPAGLTASIYASCFKLNHAIIGKIVGGQMMLAPDILNYPGFEEVPGPELTKKMVGQLEKRGGKIIEDSIIKIDKIEGGFDITTEKQTKYQTKTIILATGVERRKLNVPGEVEYTEKGLFYCSTCGKFDYENKVVAVVGGANSAAQSAVHLSHAAAKVYIIYRGSELRCDPVWLTQIKEHPSIEAIYNAQVSAILGDGNNLNKVSLKVKNGEVEETKELEINKLFVEIGGVPGTALLIPLGVKTDQGGFIEVDEKLATNVPGVFAAGDVVSHRYSIEQISSAVGFGARAAVSAFSFLKQKTAPSLWGASQIPKK